MLGRGTGVKTGEGAGGDVGVTKAVRLRQAVAGGPAPLTGGPCPLAVWQDALLDLRRRLMKFCVACRVYLSHQSKVLSEKVGASLGTLTGRGSRGGRTKGGAVERPVQIGARSCFR